MSIERVFEGDGEEYYPSDTYALALEADRNETSAWVASSAVPLVLVCHGP
ncbi:hypothetical protein CPC08DRAFT_763715 [Agrocybe pediades]|nr:hypothetical protein CPC08DRAFT_763715 [Agrocybe pediades]